MSETQTILDNIRRRRTLPYKRMKTDPISEEHLNIILDAANWAPTHRFTEPWRFHVFTGDGRHKFAQMLGRAYTDYIGEDFVQAKFDKTTTRPLHVPVSMAISLKRHEVLPEYEEMLAVGCAAQNLFLAATALNIGSSWSTPKYVDHPIVKDFLGLEDQDRCCGFLYLGYAVSEDCWPTTKRGPISEKITRVDS